MRLLTIGDIHGCSTALDALLNLVQPAEEDWIITLGDYVDRGPDSRGVLDRLLSLARTGRLVALRGNHEEMMVQARDDASYEKAWRQCGGREALESYTTDDEEATLDDVPADHWKFFDYFCVDWFEANTHFFVHANALPNLTLAEQPISVLRWMKLRDPHPHCSGKIMVCGHTPQSSGWPLDLGFVVCIDTWVYGSGWLTCLDTHSGQFWQANQRGETRTSTLEELKTLTRDPMFRL